MDFKCIYLFSYLFILYFNTTERKKEIVYKEMPGYLQMWSLDSIEKDKIAETCNLNISKPTGWNILVRTVWYMYLSGLLNFTKQLRNNMTITSEAK